MRMPTIFIGHGNPMNAIEENAYSRAWASLGRELPRPKAILCVSAHWYLPATLVTADEKPRTIHDFGGFPRPLYEVQYPAAGDADLCRRMQELLGADLNQEWGLDHGTWSVLVHLFPDADVPVVQLSINGLEPFDYHLALGEKLAPLRERGILILGSGNVVHNLRRIDQRMGEQGTDWAHRFNE